VSPSPPRNGAPPAQPAPQAGRTDTRPRPDFADFASEAPDPTPIPFAPVPGGATLGGALPASTARPFTKWYRIHERHSLSDFTTEGIILAFMAVVLVAHLIGARRNRSRARAWIRAHGPTLSSEFAVVGFGGVPASAGDQSDDELLAALATANQLDPDALLKERSLFEFASYATGRQNVAFVDVRLTLVKRFNPFLTAIEWVAGFMWESWGTPEDTAAAVLYPFDGKEKDTVPGLPGAVELRTKDLKSGFDNFVWALVNKDRMMQLREDRYDVSITYTKDHPKLPAWLTVMSESAEITDALLTPELIKAAEQAGELLDYLIVSDQPLEKPKT